MSLHRRTFLLSGATSAIAMTLPSPAWADDTFKLGVNVERTGVAESYGAHLMIAAQLALEEVNRKGINRFKMELVTEDNRTSPEQAVIVTRNLDQASVFAILGPIQTTQCRTAFPAANRASIVDISTGSSAPGLSAQNRPWTFRISALDQLITSEVIAKLHRAYPNAKTVVAAVDPRDVYEQFFFKVVAPPELEKDGFTIVNKTSPIEMPADSTDYSVFVTRVKALNPDVVLLAAVYDNAMAFMREANRQHLNVPVLGGQGLITDAMAQATGDVPLFAGQPFNAKSTDSTVQRFVRDFKARSEKELPGQYTTPTYIDVGAYETVIILADALRAIKATPKSDIKDVRAKVRDYMASLKGYQGLGNVITINKDGDAVKTTLVYRSSGGKWVQL